MSKYILEPHKSGNIHKDVCPKCGRRNCFTRYINTETGDYLHEDCGRCDHEQSCGYHYPPKHYFEQHPNLRTSWTAPSTNYHSSYRKAEPAKPRPLCFVDDKYAEQSHSTRSEFVRWLYSKNFDQQAVCRAITDYQLGATNDGGVIFWQRDIKGRLRSGKIMHYGTDGHRIGNPNWVHSLLIKREELPAEWTLTQCLFGEHLLPKYPDMIVHLVESEKTAVMGATRFPDALWLATCGCKQLKPEVVKVLQGRHVVVIPDSGQYEKWHSIMAQTNGINYTFIDLLEQYPPNTDLADLM